jgi:HK97 family phage major capsid protein
MKLYEQLVANTEAKYTEDLRVLLDPGDVIGYRADGREIRLAGGGARNTYEDWIPEIWGGAVITRVQQVSAVERLARREPMTSDTKHVPRSAGVGVETVAKGAAYGEDTSANDDVLLTARKLGKIIRIADEDLADTAQVADIIATKRLDWATSYGKYFDNATLAVTGAENGTTRPYTSLYMALRTTNSDTSYTADANRLAGAATYDNLSATFALAESGDYFSESDTVVIAHPAFRAALRGVKDSQNNPIFVQGLAGTPDTLFGAPITWTNGARLNATATDSPTGNPLLFVGNRNYLIVGDRSGPETKTASADSGAAFGTDEALLKMRARRGFAVGHEAAWAVFEKTS